MSTPNPATTEWVPLWDLNGGVNLDYKGAWAAGTYEDGEIVVHNGVAYLCVRQTTKVPTPWPVALPYGTSLPASPVDGQEAILVDSVANPTWQWRFRYNAGSSSAYKWEFIGGTTKYVEISASETVPSMNAWTYLSSGPDFLAPRAGDYTLDVRCRFNGPTGAICYVSICNASLGPNPIYGLQQAVSFPANGLVHATNYMRCLGVGAGQTLRVNHYVSQADVSVATRSLAAIPVRVS